MKNYRRLVSSSLVLSAVVIFSVIFLSRLISPSIVAGQGIATRSLSGYAWSSNIGWISFKGGNYGVKLTSDNKFINYAWSSNIGWIRFNPVIGSGDNALPTGASDPHGVELSGSNMAGWARACSVFKNNSVDNMCANELRPPEERGGWDGWISMSGTTAGGGSYGVKYDFSTGQLSNFAWGADVVGWIDFCANAATGACVTVDSLPITCTANGVENGGQVNVNDPVVWNATVIGTGGTPNYTFCWGNGLSGQCTLGESVHDYATGVLLPEHSVNRTYTSPSPEVKAKVTVTDSVGKVGNAICSIEVKDLANPKLTVFVVGNGTGTVNDRDNVSAIDGCTNSNSLCEQNYPLNTIVNLEAIPDINTVLDPDAPFDFRWSESGCAPNTSPCPVTIGAEGKSVTVTFDDQTSIDPTFTVTPGVISIEFHNAGQSAQSNESILTLTSSQAVELCVDSFKSFTGNTIKSIIDAIPGNHSPVECLLGGLPGSCANTPPNCVNVNPGGSTTFSVSVPEKLIEILNNSPYFIKLRAGNTLVPIRFEYRVRDIRP